MIICKEDESYLRAAVDARILGWIIHVFKCAHFFLHLRLRPQLIISAKITYKFFHQVLSKPNLAIRDVSSETK